ncbi:hypothetical protein E1B28_000403 [Marasmius oreades]|uniref:Uncharacterized protein n=1 Tax=Marasmius oreades TaxID=181124 RepID=A0A9P7V179_9AGAR|nr:uncharacterized protein E1B28_000403 [Marasmius oreades]KAG7098453.1 hypothetical protein E1B28_000403 [Marasmius oreades]
MPKSNMKFPMRVVNHGDYSTMEIVISDEVKGMFNHVASRKVSKAPHYPPPVNKRSHSESLALQQESREDTMVLSLLARMGMEKQQQSLQDRISSPPSPLISRISPHYSPYTPPPSIATNLHFRRTKLLKHIKEFSPLLEAVKIRLDPFMQKLMVEDEREYDGLTIRVPKEVRDYLFTFHERFEDLYQNLEEKGHKLTNKQWRELKGALKKIGGISLVNLEDRLLEICKEFVALEPTLP